MRLAVEWDGAHRTLVVRGGDDRQLAGFTGTVSETAEGRTLRGPLSAANAAAARSAAPHLLPSPIGLSTSAGTGDRLGLATPGHVAAFIQFAPDLRPVFAQQSIREMDRLGRSPQQVLDDATFGCIEAGWSGPMAADADHLKTTADIDRCLDSGYSMFTIDVGDFVTPHADSPDEATLAALPWAELEDTLPAARRRYDTLVVPMGGTELRARGADLTHAMAKYGRAVAEGARLYRHLTSRTSHAVEVEIAVDETDEPTTAAEHLYIATELHRLGVQWVSFAPRHLGRFEKGVEFAGDAAALQVSIAQHAAIAAALGPYKIGMHSGSDKFSIYPLLAEATGGLVHLKTSGTSYLVALGVVAEHNPSLFRQVYARSAAAYQASRASYQVSAETGLIRDANALPDDELPSVIDVPTVRQVLHVGYGAALRGTAIGSGQHVADDTGLHSEVMAVLTAHHSDYAYALATHLGRHIGPLQTRANAEKGGSA